MVPEEKPLEYTVTDDAPLDLQPIGDELPELRPVEDGRYELRGEHGRGGLGVVMRVFDRQLGRVVAMKLLQNPNPNAAARLKGIRGNDRSYLAHEYLNECWVPMYFSEISKMRSTCEALVKAMASMRPASSSWMSAITCSASAAGA